MLPDMVVLFEPLIDHGLRLSGCCETLFVADFTTQCSIKALIVSVLPGRAWIDVDRLDPNFDESVFEGLRCKLGAIVRS